VCVGRPYSKKAKKTGTMSIVVADFETVGKKRPINDEGYDFYRKGYLGKKLVNFFGHVGYMPLNADKMHPSHVRAMLDLKNELELKDVKFSGDLTVQEVLKPSAHFGGAAAFCGPTPILKQSEAAANNLPPIGNARVVVSMHFYIGSRATSFTDDVLPPQIEFAAKAVLAKFKSTNRREMSHVDIAELNDYALVERAQELFGIDVGRIVFPHPFEPYCWAINDVEGQVGVLCMRPCEKGASFKQDVNDVWDIAKKTAKKAADEETLGGDVTPEEPIEVQTVFSFLFTAFNRDDAKQTVHCPVTLLAMHNLQRQYNNVYAKDEEGDLARPKKVTAWLQLAPFIEEASSNDDLFAKINFLNWYIKQVHSHTSIIAGDRAPHSTLMSEFLTAVRTVIVDFSNSGKSIWEKTKCAGDDDTDHADWLYDDDMEE